ncbi:MAG: tetratricopeptide repeat protein [Candidatus Muiribacteriota bacterium]
MTAKIIKKAEPVNSETKIFEDEFLKLNDLKISKNRLKDISARVSGEISELSSQNKWIEIIDLFYPVEEKLPELNKTEFEADIRSKLSFALNQLNRFDEAVKELKTALNYQPDRFIFHHNLGYTAYNSLYSAKNREIFLRGNHKKERIELARKHFEAAAALRPDTVTNFYRLGMLVKEIENKPDKSVCFFNNAIKNWENLSNEEKEKRHQEKKNYIKALYQLGSALLKSGKTNESLNLLEKCIKNDQESNYLYVQNKYFALGKVYFAKSDYKKASEHLEAALEYSPKKEDFIIELLARTYLYSEQYEKGLKIISKIKSKYMKPYCRWTKADILTSMKRLNEAEELLKQNITYDIKSKHKTLLKLSKISYLKGDYKTSLHFADQAFEFAENKWQSTNSEALYLKAVCFIKLGQTEKALDAVVQLKKFHPGYPGLSLVEEKVNSFLN